MNAPVPAWVLVDRAMRRIADDKRRAFNLPNRTYTEHAVRAARLAVIYARCERWWRVLGETACHSDLPPVVMLAAIEAEASALSSARFWAETAEYWQAKADGLDEDDANERAAVRTGRWSA